MIRRLLEFVLLASISAAAQGVVLQGAVVQGVSFGVGGDALSFDNLYTPIGGSPTWAATDNVATLPTLGFNSSVANTPATGAVVSVSTAAQLTTALLLGQAACGQKITLSAGASFSGNFFVPALGCPTSNYLWIQTSAVASLPAESARSTVNYTDDTATNTLAVPAISPCYAGVTSLPGRPTFNCPAIPGNYMAQLITPNTSAALSFGGGAQGVRLIGLEITRTSGTGLLGSLVTIGENSTDGTGNVNHVVFDRMWCHGTELGDETNNCLRINATNYLAVVDSYIDDFLCVSVAGSCTDSKAIGGGTNNFTHIAEGPTKLVNNVLIAAGENNLYGGGPSNTIPCDSEIRGNLFLKPLPWYPNSPSYNGGYKGGNPVVVKNLFELKNMCRALIEGNEFFNTWAGFTQHGQAITFTPVNQSGGCPQCINQNITFRFNWINSANSAMDLSIVSNGGFLAAANNHLSIHDNLFSNLGDCGPNGPYCPSSQSLISNVSNTSVVAGQEVNSVTWNHNTFVYASSTTTRAAIGVSGPTIASGNNMFGMTFTNNLTAAGGGTTNSIGGSDPTNCANSGSGAALITQCWTPPTFGNNCFVNNGTHTWPGSNITSVASYSAVFVNYNNGNGGNYTVAPGACQAAGSDGLDTGANLFMLQSVLNGSPVH